MRGYFIGAGNDERMVIDADTRYGELPKLIGCDCIGIVVRNIDGREYNLVYDDEWKLGEDRTTAVCLGTDETIAGNVLVLGVRDCTCELRGLTDDEVESVSRHVTDALFADGSIHPVLWYTMYEGRPTPLC